MKVVFLIPICRQIWQQSPFFSGNPVPASSNICMLSPFACFTTSHINTLIQPDEFLNWRQNEPLFYLLNSPQSEVSPGFFYLWHKFEILWHHSWLGVLMWYLKNCSLSMKCAEFRTSIDPFVDSDRTTWS